MSTPEEEHALVDRLAFNMGMKLAANRDRSHWNRSRQWYLLRRLREEVDELSYAVNHGEGKDAWAEAADVANFAAMIADNQSLEEYRKYQRANEAPTVYSDPTEKRKS